jgi:hypothetical protein
VKSVMAAYAVAQKGINTADMSSTKRGRPAHGELASYAGSELVSNNLDMLRRVLLLLFRRPDLWLLYFAVRGVAPHKVGQAEEILDILCSDSGGSETSASSSRSSKVQG